MVEIDYERLELIVAGDVDESHRDEFDFPTIVRNARIGTYRGNDAIIVNGGKFMFAYDPETYVQLGGMGC